MGIKLNAIYTCDGPHCETSTTIEVNRDYPFGSRSQELPRPWIRVDSYPDGWLFCSQRCAEAGLDLAISKQNRVNAEYLREMFTRAIKGEPAGPPSAYTSLASLVAMNAYGKSDDDTGEHDDG